VANERFEQQPDRHPHRVVHYGHFVFRPLGPLAAFDPGIEPLVGHMIFLEGHRQNTANFADARQSSLLVRFGEFTPAFVVQTLAPLLLIFVGFATLTREREGGTLRLALSQAVPAITLVSGKWLALGAIAFIATAPAFLVLLYLSMDAVTRLPAFLMLAGYVMYLAIWSGIVVLISALLEKSRTALLSLIAIWTLLVIVIPRGLPEIASAATRLPTQVETDISIHRDVARIGDSHNPDDPYFAQFRARVLKNYGVTRVEDLPVNYRGLVAVEGERITAALFEDYADRTFDVLEQQNDWIDNAGAVSPWLAIRRLSMAAAQTDLAAYRTFLEQAEAYRYRLVQALNEMQAELLSFANDTDSRLNRVDAEHFRGLEKFKFDPLPVSALLARTLMPLLLLFALLLIVAIGIGLAARNLAKGP
jgi:ABC-2 type transport system permease protein